MTALPPGHRVVVRAFGETPMDALDHHVHLEPQDAPDPATLGPHDVLIAVRSASVGWVDLLMTSGQYQHMPHPPYVPGLEYAGEILHVGAAVRAGLKVGDAVLSDGLQTGPRSGGAHQGWGGFASYAVAPDFAVHPIPGGLSFDEACNLLGNYETAIHGLLARGRIQPGETVLVLGASGATGLAAVHVARLSGATVIATGRSDAKLAVVQAQGAHHVVNTRAEDGGVRPFRDDVRALAGGRGVDVVWDAVGGDLSLEALRCLRFGGRFLIMGWAGTPFVARGKGQRGAPNANVLPTNLLMMKGIDVLGCPTVIGTEHDPALRPPRLERLWRWVVDGDLRPLVSGVFPLSDHASALHAKWRGDAVGALVVRP